MGRAQSVIVKYIIADILYKVNSLVKNTPVKKIKIPPGGGGILESKQSIIELC